MCSYPHTGHTKPSSCATALLFLLVCCAGAAAQTHETGDGEIKARLIPDQEVVMLGEPLHLSFVVHNHSAKDLHMIEGGDTRNRLGRPESFRVTAVDAAGRPAPLQDAGHTFGGPLRMLKIPAGGSQTIRLFLPHWIAVAEPGEYLVTAQRTLFVSEEAGVTPTFRRDDKSKVATRAEARIIVVPADERRMGNLIAALGDDLLSDNWQKFKEAARELSFIPDERVVGHFVEALKRSKDRGVKFAALEALVKFGGDRPLEGLEIGVADADDQVRSAAAHKLASSKHPRAVKLLLAMWNDESHRVRLTVLHALAKMNTPESLTLVGRMTSDENETVRQEALRYLSERKQKNPRR